MLASWLSLIVSALTGGLMGAVINILYTSRKTKRALREEENGVIASLMTELRRSRALCDHNGGLKQESTAPFIRFPTTVAMHVTFEKPYGYPRLRSLLRDLEAYTMALLHLNQLMDLHDLLWISPVPATGVDEGAEGRRKKLQRQIADLCAGQEELKGVGPENFVVLPAFIDHLIRSIEPLA